MAANFTFLSKKCHLIIFHHHCSKNQFLLLYANDLIQLSFSQTDLGLHTTLALSCNSEILGTSFEFSYFQLLHLQNVDINYFTTNA